MNTYDQRKATLKTLYDNLGDVCRRHISIATYDCGPLEHFGKVGERYNYPLAYLESITDIQEGERKRSKVYGVALNIIDRQPQGETLSAGNLLLEDKLEQLFFEIKTYLELHVFGEANVHPASIQIYPDFEDDRLIRLRGEFGIEVEALDTPNDDLTSLFSS